MGHRLFVANWKMHKTVAQTLDFLHRFEPPVGAQIGIAPPATALYTASGYLRARALPFMLGGQTLSARTEEGAFTGELSGTMLKEAGASFCLVGHSERRTLYHERDELVHEKLLAALAVGLTPLLCVGESQQEREEGRTADVLQRQLAAAFSGLTADQKKSCYVAYEPLWAIGTGVSATPVHAQQAHALCRSVLREPDLPILYGGSVTPDNVHALLMQPDVDGVLVGGASLDPIAFAQLIQRGIAQ